MDVRFAWLAKKTSENFGNTMQVLWGDNVTQFGLLMQVLLGENTIECNMKYLYVGIACPNK